MGEEMKKNLNAIGVFIVICIFILFYIVTTFLLDRRSINREIKPNDEIVNKDADNYDNEKAIVANLYKNVKILYDVVNNKFRVDQDDTININNVIYKKITNFDTVMNNLFTSNGIKRYISDLSNYFAYTDSGYYLAGNLVSYQTYYFRGDNTNIYITDVKENEIDGIIYEKWTNNNTNTLALIKVVKENDKWLIDEINILSNE